MALFDDRKRVQYGNRESVMVNELEFQNLNYVDGNKRGLNMYRSGSAPPTIEGSYNAINSLFQNLDLTNNGGLPEEQMRSHPAYLSYYYSHDNINPRLPPPLLSKEEWRMQQRMRGGREIPDWRNRGFDDRFDSSLFSVQPASSLQKEKSEIIDPTVVKFSNRDLELVSRGGGLGGRRKSFADILQEGSNRPNALPSPIPCKATRNVCNEFLHSGNSNVQTHHVPSSSFPVAVGSSFSKSPTPNHPFEERFPPGKLNNIPGAYVSNGKSSSMNNLSDLAAYLSFTGLDRPGHGLVDKRSPANVPPKVNSARIKGLNEQDSYNNARAPVVTNNVPGRYSTNHNSTKGADNRLVSGSQSNGRCDKNMQLDHHNQTIDSIDVQYYRHPANSNYLLGGKYISASHGEVLESQKAHLDALISGQKQNFGLPLLQKGHRVNGYYESLAYLLSMQYQGTSMPNTFSNIRFGNSMLQSDIPSSTKGTTGMTLLEEFKNKTRHFELSDIVGHVVQFSMDQSGSRFIQQKLETATDEEKMNVFPEIALHACALMTDVFGNYVIQKFFECGMENQKQMLAGQIKTHVLQLSLQMYGCRVIQKALETINVDLKTQMVLELDGLVLKCVRDQNGNHVIQKCIECVPEDKIQIIISSFFGQVVNLSTHPYGCRVIQRVLEHCNTQDTKKRIMVEILQSIGTLAQDQYGNYVIQHIIKHGKPEERSAIINQLKGQVVHMSQQKFASNVIEKCLTFGSPEERQVLVNEVLGSADLNEPLKEMMKDPFGNYVVQKVLETCDAKTRELILSCIKLHLFDLKKCTYVKHVIARVEKLLIAAGERSLVLEGSP